jgi:dTDP-4-amino-4,6-dideoxygalactose transaminase
MAGAALIAGGPGTQYLTHKDEIDRAVRRVLDSGQYILGPEVRQFEQEFAAYLGVGHAVGVGSGTDALVISLRACGVGPGDGVVTVSHTAVATVAAVELAGAVPLLVDIEPATFTLDPNRLEDALKQAGGSNGRCKIKALIPVHLYGCPADMVAILDLARRHGLFVIEDCAQSHGASLNGRMTGGFGDAAAFSFYPTKNLGALGDGGAFVTNDRALADKAARLRQYGWRQRYVSEEPGLNSRLDEIQAAVLRVKLAHLDEGNRRRQELAQRYTRLLSGSGVMTPSARLDADHVYHQYVIRTRARDSLKTYLSDQGIPCQVHYPVPVHLQPAYHRRVVRFGPLQATEEAAREVLSLPMGPELTDAAVEAVCRHVNQWALPAPARN